MKIFTEIELEWEGKKYSVKPTMELIQSIEKKDGFSIGRLYFRHASGDLPLSIMAECYQKFLLYAGAKDVETEEVYQAFYDKEADYIMSATNAFFNACFPNQKEAKPVKKK